MNEKGNRYALAALKDKRAETAGEIKRLKDMATYRQEQLAHIDATIRLLDPEFQTDTIPPKRPRRVKLFGHAELGRLILEALRKKGRPMHVSEIVTAIIAAKGHTESARPALTSRVRGNLSYLWRRQRSITKAGKGPAARWSLASSL